MPYSSVSEIPERIKKFSPKLQRQWMHVFNTTHQNVTKTDPKNAERRAFMAANSILKKRFKKGQNLNKEQHSDYFSMIVESYLGNLNG